MKKIIMTCSTLLLMYSLPSWSKCTTNASGVTLNNGALTIQRDAIVGTKLSTQIYTSGSTLLFTCPSGSTTQYFGVKAIAPYASSVMAADGSRIYNTTYSGLGFRLGGATSSGSIGGWVGSGNNIDGNLDQVAIQTFPGPNIGSVSGGAVMSFYKTGPITGGTVSGQTIGRLVIGDGSAGGWATPEVNVLISGMKLTVLSCILNTPTAAAPLGNVYATAFGGVGTTTGSADFSLNLNCALGTQVNVTLNGTQNTDTTNTSVLALTGAGSAGVAKGVGAQILYNNTPLTIGTPLLMKTTDVGIETFNFKARYIQTLNNILPGSANATATLNITYQ